MELKLKQRTSAIANTANVVFDDSEFTNSAEVEQETEQENECTDVALCINLIGAQTQTAASAIANTANVVFDDSEFTNSAEVEQETEQENECGPALCDNTILAQTQTGTCCHFQHRQCD